MEGFEEYIKAGKIVAQVREEAVSHFKVGVSFIEILDFCEKRIVALGAQVAWAQLSPTTTAAHFCPTKDDNPICKQGDLLKLDIGAHIDGYIADTAVSVQIETKEYSDLIKASQKALEKAIKLVKPGTKLWEIGEAQMSEAEAAGFTTIKNLSGHNLERYTIHGGITVPSYNNHDQQVLTENMVIAIEPFITTGVGYIEEKGEPTVFMQISNSSTRSLFGKKIMPKIKTYKGLAFATRYFDDLGPAGKAGIRDLHRQGIIRGYPPLVERTKKPVAQSEHSIIVRDKPLVFTKSQE